MRRSIMSFPSLFTNGRLLPTFVSSLPPFVRLLPACPSIDYFFSSLHSLLNRYTAKTRGHEYMVNSVLLLDVCLFLPVIERPPRLSLFG